MARVAAIPIPVDSWVGAPDGGDGFDTDVGDSVISVKLLLYPSGVFGELLIFVSGKAIVNKKFQQKNLHLSCCD